MDKTTILRLLLSHGMQIDQDALEYLTNNEDILEPLLNLNKSQLPSVISIEFLHSIAPTASNKIADTNKKISVSQLSQIVNYRYEFLRKLLETKEELVNLVSINKISEKLKQFSVIGIVLEKDDLITLEDTTGHSTFTLDKEMSKFIVEDEVVGFVCEQQHGTNFVKDIIYPDIPLNKEGRKTKDLVKCFFVSDMHMDSTHFNTNYYKNLLAWLNEQKDLKIFVLGDISKNEKDLEKFLADIHHPIYFHYKGDMKTPVTKQIENIQLLLAQDSFLQHYTETWNAPIDIAIVNLFRKRNLNPVLAPENFSNTFLLEEVPDIIAISGTNKSTLTNYKGTTIITTGSFLTEPIYWLINLQTRETFKIDFS